MYLYPLTGYLIFSGFQRERIARYIPLRRGDHLGDCQRS